MLRNFFSICLEWASTTSTGFESVSLSGTRCLQYLGIRELGAMPLDLVSQYQITFMTSLGRRSARDMFTLSDIDLEDPKISVSDLGDPELAIRLGDPLTMGCRQFTLWNP